MSTKLKSLLKRCMLGGVLGLTIASASHAITVDLLVTYDEPSRAHFGGEVDTAMRGWVSQMNDIYRNSQVDIQMRLVGTMYINIPGNGFGEILPNLRVDGAVAQKRNDVGADFVAHLTPGNCGLGYVAVDKNWAFNVVGPDCGAQVMAHELGHNMGLNHSRRQGNTGGARWGYALGHGVDSIFASTMAYPQAFGTTWAPTFSNPRTNCRGVPCGVPAGQSQEADATQALNNVRGEIAEFYPAAQNEVTYKLRALHSNRCLEVGGWSKANGGNIMQWDCHGGANQRWRLLDGGNGYWKLQNVNSGKCLDINAGSIEHGANSHQWDCVNVESQKLWPNNLFSNVYQFGFKHSGKCLDVQNGSNGSNIYQWGCHGNDNQRFYLEP